MSQIAPFDSMQFFFVSQYCPLIVETVQLLVIQYSSTVMVCFVVGLVYFIKKTTINISSIPIAPYFFIVKK